MNIQQRSITTEEHRKKPFASCADRWVQDADFRQCVHEKQQHVRNSGDWGSNCKWTTEHLQNDATAKAGTIRKAVAHCYQRVSILNWECSPRSHESTPRSGRPYAMQEVPLHKHHNRSIVTNAFRTRCRIFRSEREV